MVFARSNIPKGGVRDRMASMELPVLSAEFFVRVLRVRVNDGANRLGWADADTIEPTRRCTTAILREHL